MYTKGPWEWDGNVCDYDKDNEAPWLVTERKNNTSYVVLSGEIECDSEANARLIAAAPELLEALEEANDMADKLLRGVPVRNADEVILRVSKAIAKAKGGI